MKSMTDFLSSLSRAVTEIWVFYPGIACILLFCVFSAAAFLIWRKYKKTKNAHLLIHMSACITLAAIIPASVYLGLTHISVPLCWAGIYFDVCLIAYPGIVLLSKAGNRKLMFALTANTLVALIYAILVFKTSRQF